MNGPADQEQYNEFHSREVIEARREEVKASYYAGERKNKRLFLENNPLGTSQYVYDNQKKDASNIVDLFYKKGIRAVSVIKKTKVGADGLMIELLTLFTIHQDDDFVANTEDVRILTGMSNVSWENDMRDKLPECFKGKIFHHGKLRKAGIDKLSNSKNTLFIIDEIDSGDKQDQKLHTMLKESEILNIKHMKCNNNRFVFISATPFKELYELYQWGDDAHETYRMTIPDNYIGHKEFLEKNIIREWYPLSNSDNANRWVQEDIIDHYGNDYRVHIVRVKGKTLKEIRDACIRKRIEVKNHTSTDRIPYEDFEELCTKPLTGHVVIVIKGLLRRANLIPNEWKKRIGAIHESYKNKPDVNVEVQAGPGRMTGYWRDVIESGHKTGPYRTSIEAIESYEKMYNEPFGDSEYKSAGIKKNKKGVKMSKPTMLAHQNVGIENPLPLPSKAKRVIFQDDEKDLKWCTDHDEDAPRRLFGVTGKFQIKDGRWRHYDGKMRTIAECHPLGGGGDAGKQKVLVYKEANSYEWTIRTMIYQ